MKKTIKLLSLVLCVALVIAALACLTACNKNTSGYKIGVLVADVSSEEALGFKKYFEEYIGKQYDVTFVYSQALSDGEGAKSAANTFIAQNCKAIIDMANQDRAAIAKICNDNEVYYAVASGVMTDEDFATCKGYKYFVGQIGPDNDTEYEAGLAMGKHFKDKVSKIAIYGAFAFFNPMHVYREAGLLVGLGCSYSGASDKDGVLAAIQVTGGVIVPELVGGKQVLYMVGYDETTPAQLSAIVEAKPDAFLSVGMATSFFCNTLQSSNIEYADIDSFSANNGAQMNAGAKFQVQMADFSWADAGTSAGKLTYLAGKYSSSIGPVFALIQSAMNGAPIRDSQGNAVSVNQNYAVATNYTEFTNIASKDSGDAPIWSKAELDKIIANSGTVVTFEAFKAAVEAK